MNGKTIKDVLTKNGIAQAEIAKRIGIAANNLNNMLAKDDVRTGLLESIAEAANIPISVFYGDSYTVNGSNNATGNNNTVNLSDDRLLSLLVSKDEQLTMAMNQTSKAQEQMDRTQSQMERILDTFCEAKNK
jgi:transcriptional regulator with XRE-family HTH domain